MTNKIKTTVVEQDQLEVWDEESESFVLQYLSNFYIVNALGQYIFYHCRNRADAQRAANADWDGKYTIRQAKMSNGSGEYTCVGTTTRARPSSRPPK